MTERNDCIHAPILIFCLMQVVRRSGPEVSKQRFRKGNGDAYRVQPACHAPFECFDCRVHPLTPRFDRPSRVRYTIQQKGGVKLS
ncbi:hypothetical protein R75465_00340 [Paraburkholderia aspalathi]|nr:hypothetical protein R75465_00340 [Paraburkholderia aspalathi]